MGKTFPRFRLLILCGELKEIMLAVSAKVRACANKLLGVVAMMNSETKIIHL